MRLSLRFIPLLLALAAPALAANWPAWRGPHGNSHCDEKDLPLTWSDTENVRWKVQLPDRGNSTPIIWGDRVFVTQAIDKDKERCLLCFDRATGKQLWKSAIVYAEKETTHGTNPYCSASPVTDGERIYVSHGSAGFFCYNFEGKELWKKDVGKQEHIWGNASSPILYEDLVILWVGPGERQVLLAMDRKTGNTVWEHNEPGGASGAAGNKEWIGSWSTPVIARVGNRDELLLSVPQKMKGFDPKNGKELWSCDGLGKLVYTSPAISKDGIVVALAGYGGPGIAVRAGGSGDVTKTHRLWHQTKGITQRIGSPIVVGETAYLVNESGVGRAFDLKTGNELWEKKRVASKTWSTPVLSGDRLYVLCENGDTVVLSVSEQMKELAVNKLGANETTRASIAVSDGELFIRTYKHLYCIGKK